MRPRLRIYLASPINDVNDAHREFKAKVKNLLKDNEAHIHDPEVDGMLFNGSSDTETERKKYLEDVLQVDNCDYLIVHFAKLVEDEFCFGTPVECGIVAARKLRQGGSHEKYFPRKMILVSPGSPAEKNFMLRNTFYGAGEFFTDEAEMLDRLKREVDAYERS